MNRPTLTVALTAAVLMLTGCTTDDQTADITTTVATVEVDTETTTTSTTTAPATTSTTIDPVAQAEADVEAAYLKAYDVFNTCYVALPECDPATVFAEVYTEGTYEAQVDAALQAQADGLIYEEPENPAHAQTQIFGIRFSQGRTKAVVDYCTWSAHPELAISPDGTRIPVGFNDTALVAWGEAKFVLEEDEVWRAYDYDNSNGDIYEVPLNEIDDRIEKGDLCGNASTDA